MGAVAGRFVRIYKGATLVAGARSDTIKFNNEAIDVTDKSDGGFRQLLDEIALRSVDMDVSGLLKMPDLLDIATGSTSAQLADYTIVIAGLNGSDYSIAGQFFLSNFEIGGEHDGAASFSCSLMSHDQFTYAAVSAPTITAGAAIVGDGVVGNNHTALDGIWTGFPTITYQWQTDASGSFANISGANSRVYVPVGGDSGDDIRCVVTGTNTAGSVSSTTNAITVA